MTSTSVNLIELYVIFLKPGLFCKLKFVDLSGVKYNIVQNLGCS